MAESRPNHGTGTTGPKRDTPKKKDEKKDK